MLLPVIVWYKTPVKHCWQATDSGEKILWKHSLRQVKFEKKSSKFEIYIFKHGANSLKHSPLVPIRECLHLLTKAVSQQKHVALTIQFKVFFNWIVWNFFRRVHICTASSFYDVRSFHLQRRDRGEILVGVIWNLRFLEGDPQSIIFWGWVFMLGKTDTNVQLEEFNWRQKFPESLFSTVW